MEPMTYGEDSKIMLGEDGQGKFTLVYGQTLVRLSEAELRWLVTTAGPAVLPRREPVR